MSKRGAADTDKVRKFEHPGRGRSRARPVPKGRQVDPRAQAEIEALLGDAPRNRDLLIEYLHRIQDMYGQISAPHLAALADTMRLAFDVVKEGGRAIPSLTVRVCDSLTCAMLGGEELLATLQRELGAEVRVVRAP